MPLGSREPVSPGPSSNSGIGDKGSRSGSELPFQVWSRDADCYLVVQHMDVTRHRVTVADVLAAVAEWPLESTNEEAIQRAIEVPQAAMKFATLNAPDRPRAGAAFFVSVTTDGVTAYLAPTTAGWGKPADPAAAADALKLAGVTTGLDEETLAALADAELVGPRPVARGRRGERASDAEVEWPAFGAVPGGSEPAAPEQFISQVQAGQVLALRRPPADGTPTLTVFGTEAPPPVGFDVNLDDFSGSGTRVDEEIRLVATMDGCAVYGQGLVRVFPTETGSQWIRVVAPTRPEAAERAAALLQCDPGALYSTVERRIVAGDGEDEASGVVVVLARRELSENVAYTLWYEAGECFAAVLPRARSQVRVQDLEREAEGWPLDEYDPGGLERALTEAGQRHRFGRMRLQAERTEPEMQVGLKLPQDRMSAWLVPLGQQRAKPALEGIQGMLSEQAVTAGVDEDGLAKLAESGVALPVKVAHGRPAQDGTEARVEMLVQRERKSARPEEQSDGSVDHRVLNLLETVEPGQAVARLIPGRQPESGLTVTGEPVSARASAQVTLERVIGKNVVLSEDGLEARSTVGGMPLVNGGRVDVIEVFRVNGDLDYSVGNI
ncbi:MAG: flagellar assembly protein A, partial [Chloroflexota bacterium]